MIKLAQRQKRCQCQPSAIAISPDRASAMNAYFWNNSRTRQPAWGNQALQRQLHTQGLPAKFILNRPGDKYEHEADRVAEKVVGIPEPQRRKAPICDADTVAWSKEEILPHRLLPDRITPLIHNQTETAGEKANRNQRTFGHPSHVAAAIGAMRGGGRPLPEPARIFFESRFGADFSDVRLHTDRSAARIAQDLDAKAFTIGSDVVFGANAYNQASPEGQHLLAHELVHVVQQGAAAGTGLHIQRQSPAGAGQAGFRLDSVAYDDSGSPLSSTPLTPDESSRLQKIMTNFRSINADLYAQVENENLLLSRAELFKEEKTSVQPGASTGMVLSASTASTVESGKFFPKYTKKQTEKFDQEWLAFDNAGGDCQKGINPPEADVDRAFDQIPESVLKNLGDKKSTRYCLDKTHPSVIVLDLDNITKRGEDAVSVLEHEIGHYLFSVIVQFEREADPTFTGFTAIPEKYTDLLKAKGYPNISDEAQLLTELAARHQEGTKSFNQAHFSEEFDPSFGIEGYRDINATPSSPTGFGIQVAEELTLLDAKAVYRSLQNANAKPVLLPQSGWDQG